MSEKVEVIKKPQAGTKAPMSHYLLQAYGLDYLSYHVGLPNHWYFEIYGIKKGERFLKRQKRLTTVKHFIFIKRDIILCYGAPYEFENICAY